MKQKDGWMNEAVQFAVDSFTNNPITDVLGHLQSHLMGKHFLDHHFVFKLLYFDNMQHDYDSCTTTDVKHALAATKVRWPQQRISDWCSFCSTAVFCQLHDENTIWCWERIQISLDVKSGSGKKPDTRTRSCNYLHIGWYLSFNCGSILIHLNVH